MRPFRFLLLFVLLFALSAHAQEIPPAPAQWFTDRAGLLDSSQAAALNEKLRAFEQETGHQFIIYILPSVPGGSIEDFTIRAATQWKVGQSKYDNGLIVFVFVAEKKVRVEVGYGLEGAVTDAISSRVIREQIAPHFQRNDWAGGLNAAADALMARIRSGEKNVDPLQRSADGGDEPAGIPSVVLMLLLFIFIFFVLPSLMRGRGCSGCIFPMFFPGGSGITFGGGGGGFGGGFGGGGGFSGGGGSFGGGGATGGW